jgi:hypothetical protein
MDRSLTCRRLLPHRARFLAVAAILGAMTSLATAGVASADQTGTDGAFLCPIVGDGVLNASSHGGVSAIQPAAGTSILPGNNQAGSHANANALNANGGPTAGNTPGTAGFTPIWNP